MIKNVLLGAIVPLLLVGVGVGVMLVLTPPAPSKKPPIEDNRGALLGQMLSAEVQTVHALAEVTDKLQIPVNGTVVPSREIQLAAEVAGRIIEKAAGTRSGNYVKAGDELYRIDPRDYELEVERVTRRLDQERASLAEQQQDIDNAMRLAAVADEEMALSEAEVARFERLGGNFRSEAELDQAKRSRLASMNQRVTIQNQISLLKARRARLESAIKLAETELEQAQLNLERTVIRAPISGRVVSEQIEADSYVQRGTPLVVIEDTSDVEVSVNLRMDQLYWILDQPELSTDSLVNAAQASRYQLPHHPVKVIYSLAGRESVQYEWSGVLARFDGAGIDPQSRTVPIRVLVDKPDEYRINGREASKSSASGPSSLVRGMFVEVIIAAQPSTPLLLVPKLSVKPATGSSQIWKFAADPRALEVTRERLRAEGSLAKTGSPKPGVAPPTAQADSASPATVDPSEWQAGFLSVIDGIGVIGPYRGPAPAQQRVVGVNAANSSGQTRLTATQVAAVGANAVEPDAVEPDAVEPDAAQSEAAQDGSPQPVAGGRPTQDFDDGPAAAELPAIEYWVCEARRGGLAAGDQVVVTPLPGIEADKQKPIRVRRSQLK